MDKAVLDDTLWCQHHKFCYIIQIKSFPLVDLFLLQHSSISDRYRQDWKWNFVGFGGYTDYYCIHKTSCVKVLSACVWRETSVFSIFTYCPFVVIKFWVKLLVSHHHLSHKIKDISIYIQNISYEVCASRICWKWEYLISTGEKLLWFDINNTSSGEFEKFVVINPYHFALCNQQSQEIRHNKLHGSVIEN